MLELSLKCLGILLCALSRWSIGMMESGNGSGVQEDAMFTLASNCFATK